MVTKKEAPEKEERLFVLREKKIDAFTTLRTRHLLTPCVCEKCAFDVCEKNGLGEWDDLETEEKMKVKQAIKKHKELHVTSENKVVKESELATSYLHPPKLVG
jgi:hypothetical protein